MLDAPLQFHPILVPKVWGGRRLETLGKALPEGEAVGESWEVADLPGDGPTSVIASGPLEGRTLRSLVERHQDELMGNASLSGEDRFPLLIKYLDACDNLSVQVHPDEAWAATHSDAFLKSEAWVVMDALPGSRIWAGVKPGTTAASMQNLLDAERLTECLQWREAHVGSCHTLPSGTCHALGTGVLVAEVQTTSDTTFRLWDWGRTGRTMHVAESLACIDFETPPPDEVQPAAVTQGLAETRLADTPWFQMRRVDSAEPTNWRSDLHSAPMVLMCLAGTAHATGPGGSSRLRPGSTVLLPAAMEQASVEMGENASLLVAQPCVA